VNAAIAMVSPTAKQLMENGYYLMLKPLKQGTDTIHCGGTFHFDAGEVSDEPVNLPKDCQAPALPRPSC
jgi:hypothetical protein